MITTAAFDKIGAGRVLPATFVALGTILWASWCGGVPARAEGLQPNTIYKIGWATDKTKYLSFVDEPLHKGMLVAIDEINARGGIDGKVKIELDARDMKADPMLGATVVQELIASGANFIVTTCDTDVSLPGAQIAAAHKLPVMSSCGADAAGPSQVKGEYAILLLDEPSLGLAPIVVSKVFDIIATLKRRGITILLVEQNVERALEVADRGYVLTTGRLELSGRADMLVSSEIEDAYLGLSKKTLQ